MLHLDNIPKKMKLGFVRKNGKVFRKEDIYISDAIIDELKHHFYMLNLTLTAQDTKQVNLLEKKPQMSLMV